MSISFIIVNNGLETRLVCLIQWFYEGSSRRPFPKKETNVYERNICYKKPSYSIVQTASERQQQAVKKYSAVTNQELNFGNIMTILLCTALYTHINYKYVKHIGINYCEGYSRKNYKFTAYRQVVKEERISEQKQKEIVLRHLHLKIVITSICLSIVVKYKRLDDQMEKH